MLPILIVPDGLFEPAELPRVDVNYFDPKYFVIPTKWKRPRKAPMRIRCRLARVIEIRHKLRIPHANHSAPGSLQDCDQLLKVLMRRKIDSLERRERAEISRVLQSGHPITVSALTLSPGAATWLLWAMSWRGVSTARQIASPPLHAPTLIVQWWATCPGRCVLVPPVICCRSLATVSHVCTGSGAQSWNVCASRDGICWIRDWSESSSGP